MFGILLAHSTLLVLCTLYFTRNVSGQGILIDPCTTLTVTTTEDSFDSHSTYGDSHYGTGLSSCWETVLDSSLSSTHVVRAEFGDFELEYQTLCLFDRLVIYCRDTNGITYSTVGSYCGETEFEGYTYGTSDGGSLVFEFTTDLSRQFEGFRVHFVAVESSSLSSDVTHCNATATSRDNDDDDSLTTALIIVIVVAIVITIACVAGCVFCAIKASSNKPRVVVQPVAYGGVVKQDAYGSGAPPGAYGAAAPPNAYGAAAPPGAYAQPPAYGAVPPGMPMEQKY